MDRSAQGNLALFLQSLLIAANLAGPLADAGGIRLAAAPSGALDWAALASLAAGASLALVAIAVMRNAFTIFASPREEGFLVLGWPYSWMRNPIYTGLLLAESGWALWNRSLAAGAAMVLLAVVLRFKVGVEEHFLKEKYGEDYLRYSRRVNRFLPGPRFGRAP